MEPVAELMEQQKLFGQERLRKNKKAFIMEEILIQRLSAPKPEAVFMRACQGISLPAAPKRGGIHKAAPAAFEKLWRPEMTDNTEPESFRGFSGNQLKIVAIAAMTLDHLAWTLWPGYGNKSWQLILIHFVGRLAAPVMWFMISEGYRHTRSFKKYLLRLFVFAVISHFAYNFCFGISFVPFRDSVLNQTSVIWALFCAALALYVDDDEKRKFPLKNWQKAFITACLCLLAFPSDWSCFPVLCTLHIHGNQGNLRKQVSGMLAFISMYVVVWCIAIDVVYGLLQYGIIIVWPFMHFYNGSRGKWRGMKWFFYLFYVGHLILLGMIRVFLYGNASTIVG